MNKKTKIIAMICSGILVLIFILYYYFFVYGFNVSTSILLDTNVKIKDNIVSVTADTANSGYAFAGYDTVWIVDELQIKPRYCIASNYNRSRKLEIVYDAKDRRLDKIFLVGITEDDKKQIWPNKTTVEPNLLIGVYELQETDEPVKPRVVLKDHEQFVFTYSALSSYLPIGTYRINKNNLILETDDGKYQYVFEIKNNTLIFNKEESSLISLGNVKDGSVFVIQDAEVDSSDEYISETIMSSELAGYIGKTESEIEARYGPLQSEGEWYNGLLYVQHENFSGSIGYRAADPGRVIENIETDSICNTIAFKLSEIVPVSNVTFNKDELEFVDNDSEGDYYYTFKNIDIPIHIGCNEDGDIEQDPWIFIYSEHQ